MPIRLIAQIRDTCDSLGSHQMGNILLQFRLVYLIRDLGHDDTVFIALAFLYHNPGAHCDGTSPCHVCVSYASAPHDQAGGGKIGAFNDLHKIIHGGVRVIQKHYSSINNFTQIMRRDAGCHGYSYTGNPVDQQIWQSGRQNHRLL